MGPRGKAAGVDPTRINHVAFSGGGEALAAILGNQVTVGISGLGEFLPQVEAGHDVSLRNWHIVSAAPGLSDLEKAILMADIDKLANSAGWAAPLFGLHRFALVERVFLDIDRRRAFHFDAAGRRIRWPGVRWSGRVQGRAAEG